MATELEEWTVFLLSQTHSLFNERGAVLSQCNVSGRFAGIRMEEVSTVKQCISGGVKPYVSYRACRHDVSEKSLLFSWGKGITDC